MLKISEFFLSTSAKKAATNIVRLFRREFRAITLGPVDEFENHNHHPITPPRCEITVFSTAGKTDDEIFDAMMCRNPNNVIMFMIAYGRDGEQEVCEVSFNGDFANLTGGKTHKMVLSGAEQDEINEDIMLIPFEDQHKGWKRRIANGETMWPIKGLPTRFQASAACVRADGTITPLSYWRESLINLLDLEPEKELRKTKKELEESKKRLEEIKLQRQATEEALKKEASAVHTAEKILYDYVEEEGIIYEYGGNIDKTIVFEHFDSEDHIAIDVYAYGIRTKDRYIFAKDGKSLVKIEKNV
ncbi:hypothetical protein IJG04_01725 [Candidatus Saccharibacteria bacterium]|nr:hypothetical protein [Candidatus Saccharibacteria bacterium]